MTRIADRSLLGLMVVAVLVGVTCRVTTVHQGGGTFLKPGQDIQVAIDALAETGGEVRLGEGVWRVATPVIIRRRFL